MSVFTRVHTVLGRIFGVAEQDTHDLLTAIAEHVTPIVEQARMELLADINAIVAAAKVDGHALAAEIVAEVDRLLAHNPAPADPTPAPAAPVEPPTTAS